MPKHTHGGRRKNQTGRPPKPESRYVKKAITLPPDTYAVIKAAQQPGESFSKCVVRLVTHAIASR
jgi:hypothetical protein